MYPGKVNLPIEVINPPSLLIKAKLWFSRQNSGDDYSLLIYQNDDLVKTISPFSISSGIGHIDRLTGLLPNQTYRFVLTKTYYLPRQTISQLNETVTPLNFNRQLPFDFYPDGQFNLKDIWVGLTQPFLIIFLFLK